MPAFAVNRIAVLGLGLIGGSLLQRLAGVADVVGYDNDPDTRAAASSVPGAVISDTVADAVRGADLVVLAVPLTAADAVLAQMSHYDGLLTDVTSVKAPARELARRHCPDASWVGGHPMAGTEHSGFAAAFAALFDGAAWVLCLDEDTQLDAWLTIADLLTGLGARVVPSTSEDHDRAVARISHLPHLAAAGLAEGAADGALGPLALSLAASSFRDGTRVAATRVELMAAMCGNNASALGEELDKLIARLIEAREILLSSSPEAGLAEWFIPGHEVRAAWPTTAGPLRTVPAERQALLEIGRNGGWITAVQGNAVSAT